MPRAGLSAAVLEEEAARTADEIGYDGLTLAVLARRFDVAVPSLYKHVAGLPALQRSLALRGARLLAESLVEALDAAPSGSALRDVAVAYRRFAHRHPGLYSAVQRAPAPDDEEWLAAAAQVVAPVSALLAARGITGEAAIDATRAVRSALHGFVELESIDGFGLPRDPDASFSALIRLLDAGLATSSR